MWCRGKALKITIEAVVASGGHVQGFGAQGFVVGWMPPGVADQRAVHTGMGAFVLGWTVTRR
jgi:hypothetical protein